MVTAVVTPVVCNELVDKEGCVGPEVEWDGMVIVVVGLGVVSIAGLELVAR